MYDRIMGSGESVPAKDHARRLTRREFLRRAVPLAESALIVGGIAYLTPKILRRLLALPVNDRRESPEAVLPPPETKPLSFASIREGATLLGKRFTIEADGPAGKRALEIAAGFVPVGSERDLRITINATTFCPTDTVDGRPATSYIKDIVKQSPNEIGVCSDYVIACVTTEEVARLAAALAALRPDQTGTTLPVTCRLRFPWSPRRAAETPQTYDISFAKESACPRS
jgi:hypothetical protein